jgi:hypothetical protein
MPVDTGYILWKSFSPIIPRSHFDDYVIATYGRLAVTAPATDRRSPVLGCRVMMRLLCFNKTAADLNEFEQVDYFN